MRESILSLPPPPSKTTNEEETISFLDHEECPDSGNHN